MTAGSNYYLLASRQGKKKSHLRFKLSRREKIIECVILTPLSWQLSKPNADAFPKRLAGINKSAYVQTIRLSSRKALIVYATNNFMESCSILMPPMCRLLLVSVAFLIVLGFYLVTFSNENFQFLMRSPRMTLVRFAPVESKT
jgi:hypothetical protein